MGQSHVAATFGCRRIEHGERRYVGEAVGALPIEAPEQKHIVDTNAEKPEGWNVEPNVVSRQDLPDRLS